MIFRSVRDAAKAICLLTCLGATVLGGGAHAAGVLDRAGVHGIAGEAPGFPQAPTRVA